MKKRILGAVMALMVSVSVLAQKTAITEKQLPAEVKKSVVKHFGKKSISSIVRDKEWDKTTYDVYFADQTKAEFRSNGVLKEAKNYNGLPASVVPAKIQAYVKKNFPNAKITKYERGTRKQEIKLNNGLEAEFDLNGNFRKLDD